MPSTSVPIPVPGGAAVDCHPCASQVASCSTVSGVCGPVPSTTAPEDALSAMVSMIVIFRR
ncbi:hypothetical protein GFS60_07527 (plasmid) [Rhodococcus sp. WAY2]|nr:hypothetical protein GFS60_07527 [Rhodococcus sp. WAY2]